MFKKKLITFFGFAFLLLLGVNFYFEYFLSPEIDTETHTKQYVSTNCGSKIHMKDEYDKCMDLAKAEMIKDKVIEEPKNISVNKIFKVFKDKESSVNFEQKGTKIFIADQKDHLLDQCVGSGFIKQFIAPDNSLEIDLLSSKFMIVCSSEDKKNQTLFFSDNFDRTEVNKLAKALMGTVK